MLGLQRHRLGVTGRLTVVTETGEAFEDPAATIRRLQIELGDATHHARSLALQLADAVADREARALEHRHWPTAVLLHQFWMEQTARPGSLFDAECFWVALPFITKYGEKMCRAAVIGAAFDHYAVEQKNGLVTHYNEWTRIFAPRRKKFGSPVFGKDAFEGWVRRAPRACLDSLAAEGEFEKLTLAARRLVSEALELREERAGRQRRPRQQALQT